MLPLPVEDITRLKFKACIVGDRAVGKTCLLNRFIFNYFSAEYKGTLGATLRYLNVQEAIGGRHLVEAETAFFDLMGETRPRENFTEIFFWGTQGFLAVADATRPETVRSLPDWIRAVQSVAGDVPYRILQNKSDLLGQSAISPQDTAYLLNEFPGVPYHLTSAKSGEGVDRAFDGLLESMVGVGLDHARVRRQSSVLGDKILALAKRRGLLGLSKKDLLSMLKDVNVKVLMQEIEDLRVLGLVTLDVVSSTSFRLRITPKGEQQLERILAPERIGNEVA